MRLFVVGGDREKGNLLVIAENNPKNVINLSLEDVMGGSLKFGKADLPFIPPSREH